MPCICTFSNSLEKWDSLTGSWLVSGVRSLAAAMAFVQPGQIGKGVLFLSYGPRSCNQDDVCDIADNGENDGDIYNHFWSNPSKYVHMRVFDLKIGWFHIGRFSSELALV
jgi:hypothetical protein